MLLYSNEKMFLWQGLLAEHSALCKEIELQELCSCVSSLQDIKVDSPDSGLWSFPGHLSGLGNLLWPSLLRPVASPPVFPPLPGVRGVQQLCKHLAQISLFSSCDRTRGQAKFALT